MTEIVIAKIADKPDFRILLDSYISEFEQYIGVQPDYPYFDAYWQEPNSRWPYLIRDQGEVVGFVLVNTWSPSGEGTDFSIAEFYIIPESRRRFIGNRAALATFRTHPGIWEVSVVNANLPALNFWTQTLNTNELSNLNVSHEAEQTIFRFQI